MKSQKRLTLVFILALTAIIMTACSLFPPKNTEPTIGDIPPVTADQAVPGTPHALDGAFANCMSCHAAAEGVHLTSWWVADSCIACHPAVEGAGDVAVSISTLTLPGNHNSAAFANCAMCHNNDAYAQSVPHVLDGMYADCASCHTVEYGDGSESADGDAAGGLAAVVLPGNHDSAAFANCVMCHNNDAYAQSVPHALDGMYADCATCHEVSFANGAAAPEQPAAEKPAAEQPAAEKPAASGPGPVVLPANHDSAAFANCVMCHNNDAYAQSVPHALDGAYATCATCHAVSYK